MRSAPQPRMRARASSLARHLGWMLASFMLVALLGTFYSVVHAAVAQAPSMRAALDQRPAVSSGCSDMAVTAEAACRLEWHTDERGDPQALAYYVRLR